MKSKNVLNNMATENMEREDWIEFIKCSINEMNSEEFSFLFDEIDDEVKEDVINSDMFNSSSTLDKLTEKILDWHKNRKITINGNSITQSGKLVEEVSELILAIQRKDKPEVSDAIGDAYVVITSIAELEGLTMEECIGGAYNEIKDRKGHLDVSGNFIKIHND